MRHLRRPVCIVLPCLATVFSIPGRVAGAVARAAEEARLVFGLLPILGPERLMRRFGPLADDLSQSLGVAVALRISSDDAS